MESTLRLRLLGPVQVERDGEPVRGFRSRKALALLGYLALQDHPIPREHLVDLFWGDKSEDRGRSNLSWVLHKISTLLPGCLQAERHTVQFQRTAPYWLDIAAFEEMEAQGNAPSLVAAAELYRGELLEGMYLDDCAEFEIWLVAERELWRQRVARVLETLVTHHSQRGAYPQGLRFARRLLTLEPWREETHRQAMRLLAYSDQRGAALAQYETCRRVLAEELGVEPAAETTRLYERIREGELEIPVPPQAPTRKHNLPAQLTPFVGREALLAEIADRLQDPACRLLTLVGPGGSGKTRLALEAAAAQLDNYTHGVFFASLAPLDSAAAIVPTVAEALGFRFYEGGQPQQQLLDYLRHKTMLIVMDNFEHLLPPSIPPAPVLGGVEGCGGDEGGVGLVTEVLKTAPEVKILATSRARLNVQGEHLFPVGGMSFPDSETTEDASQYSAVRLFLQSACRAQPAFEVTGDNLRHAARICHLVQGMPLGILLAAAWVSMLTPAEIADQISGEMGQSLDFLEADLRDVPRRQRSMRAVFDHSYRLLTEREREVFQELSVFRGGFTHQAAQYVADASLRELRSLVDKSLLQRDPAGRYGIHELLRQYAAEKLGEVPAEEEAVRDRHCTYYAGFLQQREAHLVGRNQKQALAEIGAEIENLRAGWDWAVAQGKIEEMDRCLENLAEFYRIRGRFQEGEEAFARAAQRLAEVQEEIANRESKIVLGKVLSRQGRFCDYLGLVEKGRELLQKSLAIFRDLGARREMAYALHYLGDLFLGQAESKPLYQEGLAIFKEIGDRRGIALSLWSLGVFADFQGEYGAAKQLIQETLTIFRELGNQQGIADSLNALGWNSWILGEYRAAKQLHQESLALHREIGDQRGIADCLNYLARDGAGLGEYREAKRLLQESLAIGMEVGDAMIIAEVVAFSGEVADVLGDYAEAFQLAQESLALFKKMDDARGIIWSLRGLGNAARGLKDLPGARRYFRQALEAAITVRETSQSIALLTLVGIAALLAGKGEKGRALEFLVLVLHRPESYQWAKDRAAPLVAELEAELSPDVVAAAQERGRARDLETTVAELLVELGG